MLKWLLGGESDTRIPQILSQGNVGYLSASCCNPAAASVDEQLVQNIKESMVELGIDLEIHKETLTNSQAAIPSVVKSLDARQNAVVQKVMSLFTTKGLAAFPILFINGDLAFYGGVPTKDEIAAHMRKHLTRAAEDEAGRPASQA